MAVDGQHDRWLILGAAAIATAGTLLATGIGVYATMRDSSKQIDAQAGQEQRSFLRTQRQATYAQVLQTDGTLTAMEKRFTAPCSSTAASSSAIESQLEELGNDANAVALVGSERASLAARKLLAAHKHLVDDDSTYCGMLSHHKATPPFVAIMESDAERVTTASGHFLDAARADVQTEH